MWRGVLGCLVMACSSGVTPVGDGGRDAGATSSADAVTARDAPFTPLDTCPPGWIRVAEHQCVPPAMACDRDAGSADPQCLPGGVRTAARTPWSCPTGWRHDAEGGCVPTLRTDCPEGSGPLPDGTCTDTSGCPDGPFPAAPEGVDARLLIHVDDDAPEGGDGSRARPLRDLNAAIEAADPRGAVLIAAGRYEVAVNVPGPRVVRGVCPSRVSILRTPEGVSTPGAQGAGFALLDPAASLDLSGVTLDGQSTHILLMRAGLTHIHHAVVRGVGGGVLTHFGGRMELDEIAFHSPRTAGSTKLAYSAEAAERVTIRRVSASGQTELYQSDGSDGVIEDSVTTYAGISLFQSGSFRVARVALHGAARALRVEQGVRVELEDAALTGYVEVRAGGRLTGRRVQITDGSVSTLDLGSSAELTDVAVRFTGDTVRDSADCANAAWGAHVSLRRARLGPCWAAGAFAYLLGEIELEDTYIHDPRPGADQLAGVGAGAVLSGSLSLRRVVVERAALAGVAAMHLSRTILGRLPLPTLLPMHGQALVDRPSRVSLSDVVLRDSRNAPEQPSFALAAGANSSLQGERISVLGQQGAGLMAVDSGFERRAFVDGIDRVAMLDEPGRRLLAAVLPPYIDGPSSVTLSEVFVGQVRRAPSLYDSTKGHTLPESESAYGAYTSPGCSLSITNGYFDGANGTETALASLGALTLRGGVIAGVSRCAATQNRATEGTVSIDGVRMQGNGRDEVCDDNTLPALRLPMSPN